MKSDSNCRYLRAKSMFIPALAQQAAPDLPEQPAQAGHCWCNRTLTETGPDDRPVGPEVCDASRPCFERHGAAS